MTFVMTTERTMNYYYKEEKEENNATRSKRSAQPASTRHKEDERTARADVMQCRPDHPRKSQVRLF